MKRQLLFAFPLVLTMAASIVLGQQPVEAGNVGGGEEAAKKQMKREKQFAKKLTGAVLEGSYTVVGQDEKPQGAERYAIQNVEKLQKNYWLIVARVQYNDHDLKVPVTVQVSWADDTPVLSLTELKLPSLGTFTARVLFFGDRYAGTWQHGDVGGHLFGRVQQEGDADKETR